MKTVLLALLFSPLFANAQEDIFNDAPLPGLAHFQAEARARDADLTRSLRNIWQYEQTDRLLDNAAKRNQPVIIDVPLPHPDSDDTIILYQQFFERQAQAARQR